jgi:hypothetical protein
MAGAAYPGDAGAPKPARGQKDVSAEGFLEVRGAGRGVALLIREAFLRPHRLLAQFL